MCWSSGGGAWYQTGVATSAARGARCGGVGLDLLWPILLLIGVESIRVDPGHTAFTPFDFEHYPWSHSLSMAVVWAVAVGRLAVVVLKRSVAGLLIGLALVSHWLLDYVTHIADLPLWPGGPEVGLGLWNSIPGTLLVEGSLLVAVLGVYVRGTRPRRTAGKWSLWSLILLTTLIWISGPWSPPPPGERAIALVGLAMWLLPLWGSWIDRTRSVHLLKCLAKVPGVPKVPKLRAAVAR